MSIKFYYNLTFNLYLPNVAMYTLISFDEKKKKKLF